MFLKHLFTIPFLLLICNAGKSQRNFEADSSWIRLNKMQDDTNKVMALFDKALTSSVYDIELSGFYAKKTYALAKRLNFRKGIIYSCDVLGNFYLQSGNYADSYEWMSLSIRLKEEKGDPFELALGYNQFAVLFRQMQNFKMALSFSKKSMAQCELMKNDKFIGLSISTHSNIYYESGDLDSALYFNKKALELHRKAGDSSSIALSLTNQGVIYSDQKKYDLSIEKSTEALNFIEDTDKRLALICHSNLATAYLGKNELEKAEKSFQIIFSISDEFAEADQLMLVHKIYSEFLAKKGRHKEAYEYQSSYLQMKDSIDDVKVRNELAGLEVKYQTEKKEKENQLLKQKSEIDRLTIEENTRKSFQLKLILGASGLVLVLLIFVIANRIRSSRILATQNEQINKQNNTLKQLNSDLIESEDRLQQSNEAKAELLSIISHDISSPVNSLFNYQQSILDNLSNLSKEELSDDFKKINENTKQVHALINNLLDYSFTQQNGFVKKLHQIELESLCKECISLFEQQLKEKNIDCNLSEIKNVIVTSDINLLRLIIRNLLSNALKFSPINENLIFRYDAGIFSITNKGKVLTKELIADLKTGNNQSSDRGTKGEKGTGLGMKIVRNAVHLLESELIIESNENGNKIGFKI